MAGHENIIWLTENWQEQEGSVNLPDWIRAGKCPVKLNNVLILHKKSTFQIQAIEHREARFLKLLDEGHEAVTKVKVAHSEHTETLYQLEKELDQRGIRYKSIARADLSNKVTDVDMVISVGGDGTFLDASHYLEDVPILGVNSSSSSSFGHFCLATEKNIGQVLDQIESGELEPNHLLRLELILNGSILPELILNEVLVSHANPAATSRYFVTAREIREEQRSSGIWIGTPAGSTGSLRSAGGTVLPITDLCYEYVVREPCLRPGERWQLLSDILRREEEIAVVSQMRTGTLHLDGQHIDYQFGLGDVLVVRPSDTYLRAFISEDVNDVFM